MLTQSTAFRINRKDLRNYRVKRENLTTYQQQQVKNTYLSVKRPSRHLLSQQRQRSLALHTNLVLEQAPCAVRCTRVNCCLKNCKWRAPALRAGYRLSLAGRCEKLGRKKRSNDLAGRRRMHLRMIQAGSRVSCCCAE